MEVRSVPAHCKRETWPKRPWALNASSSLERSEKVGSESREMFLLTASQETDFGGDFTGEWGLLCLLLWE